MLMRAEKNKILIAEDEASIRLGLIDVFTYHGYEVTAVENGAEALKQALSGAYHLLLLDVMLPEVDGFKICDEVRKKDRAQPILLLTAKGDEEDILQGLKLGADDYVTKPFSVRELLARCESVLRRSPKLQVEKQKIVWGALTLDPLNLTLQTPQAELELTRREVDLLRYLMKNTARPVSRQELLKEVWGYPNAQMDTRTVDIHITKLRKKIEVDAENPKLIITVRGEGYRMPPFPSLPSKN
ncbi:MAG: response regulator transcription factor [Deltaproteobacteria bacterium]|nr:response regulator transcription factor [Deltaproteobacteria bacterium]